LPQDSIIETDVAAVIQSTRQGVGRQIADMVRRLIAGEDLASLQVLWQPEFIPAKPPDLTLLTRNSEADHGSETFWLASETFRINSKTFLVMEMSDV
jgi:hypothetical protein